MFSEPPAGPNRRLWVVGGVLVALVLAGIGAAVFLTTRHDDPPVAEAAVRDWTRFHVADGDFSLSVPPGWARSHADVGSVGPVLKFQAADLGGSTGQFHFAANVNVIVEPLPQAVSLDDYVDASVGNLKDAVDLKSDLKQERLSLPAGPAERFQYRALYTTGGTGHTVALIQYLLVQGGSGYVITLTALPAQQSEYLTAFQRIAESFRIEGAG